jgi:hypothetical protein
MSMPVGQMAETLLDMLPQRDDHAAMIDPVSGLVLSHWAPM